MRQHIICLLLMLTVPCLAEEQKKPLVSPLLDAKLRYEFVDQSNFEFNANALTLRLRFGVETREIAGLSALVEGDVTQDLGVDSFNSTVNGLTQFPVVADGNSRRLNRANLRLHFVPDTLVRAGRQRIKLDNDRFVGNVGFRQNEQTFDAVRVINTSIDGLTVDYTYSWQVNRLFGSRSPIQSGESSNHFLNIAYDSPVGTVIAYAYLIDLDDLIGLSNQSYGIRLTGRQQLNADWSIPYELEFARQGDFGSNPDAFGLNYYKLSSGVIYRQTGLTFDYEVLGSDGVRGFVTPFATLRKFNGFADVFLATPAAGLQDFKIQLAHKTAPLPRVGPVQFFARFHHFRPEEAGGGAFGNEINLTAVIKPVKRWTFSLEYADFYADTFAFDQRRFFATAIWSF